MPEIEWIADTNWQLLAFVSIKNWRFKSLMDEPKWTLSIQKGGEKLGKSENFKSKSRNPIKSRQLAKTNMATTPSLAFKLIIKLIIV